MRHQQALFARRAVPASGFLQGSTRAFSLVEVALALAVTAFCLVAIFGLLPVGFNSDQAAIQQTAANGILSAVAADLRAAPPQASGGAAVVSQQFGIPIPATPSGSGTTTLYFTSTGQFSTSLSSQSFERMTVVFVPNTVSSATVLKTATLASLTVSWPAPASLANAAGSVQTLTAIARN